MRHSGWWSGVVCLTIAVALTAGQNQSEVATKDVAVTFKATSDLVMVPVVVRDGKGQVVSSLNRDDFQLFDRGKVQSITRFSVERRNAVPSQPVSEAPAPESGGAIKMVDPSAAIPDHFFAYLFDDVQILSGDLIRVQQAVHRHIDKSLGPKDRAAIYTTSGQHMLDFTDDRAKLHQAVDRLLPKPIGGGAALCPDLTYYQARLINVEHDREARANAIYETFSCAHLKAPDDTTMAEVTMMATAGRVVSTAEHQGRSSLVVMSNLARRMSIMAGRRTVVVVSPGFLVPDFKLEENEVIDRAIRAGVVFNAIDARGLYTEGPDLSKQPLSDVKGYSDPLLGNITASTVIRYKAQMSHQTANVQSDVLAEVAAGTGGTFFHNNNDLDEGLREVAQVPEYTYLLGFAPQNMKYDGAFHALKVSLRAGHPGWTVEARHGYSAPKSISDPEEVAKEEIREAIFSRDELNDLPAQLHTEYFKTGDDAAKLSVVAHVDLKPLKFHKDADRNRDEVSVVAGLFDRDGKYISSIQKNVDLKLLDANFDRWMTQGISVRAGFDVKPGTYVIRLVVRDSGGQLMAAHNGVIEIP